MSRTVAIIQARMGASRLPGKMMLWLHGHPVIEWVVRRTASAKKLDEVVVAIPDTPTDDVLASFLSNHLKAHIIRGDEQDVLGRFVKAGRHVNADRVVRICADNPMVSGEVIDDLIDFFDHNTCDYAYNQGDSGRTNKYPDGLGAQITSFGTLEWLDKYVVNQSHREHCLSYIPEHPEQFAIKTFDPQDQRIAHPELKLDLDTLDDYCRLSLKKFAINSSPIEIIGAFLEKP